MDLFSIPHFIQVAAATLSDGLTGWTYFFPLISPRWLQPLFRMDIVDGIFIQMILISHFTQVAAATLLDGLSGWT